MMNIPAIGSVVEVTTKYKNTYYYSNDKYQYRVYKGRIVKNEKWTSSDSFTIETGNSNYPVSIISLRNVSDLKILKGYKIPVRKYKVKGNSSEYIVTQNSVHFSCTCVGFKYHAKCKHITAVKKLLEK